MCGICGFVSRKDISMTILSSMNDEMIHRGPDDSGTEIFHNKYGINVGMAHRRLSILDLSKEGHQPMHSNNDDAVIVFNGEIYNYKDIKKKISRYHYHSGTDTEVIIAAYQKYGYDFVKHIDGMFALAIYDRKRNKLILARDRSGKKPLYYWKKGTDFIFASSLRSFFKFPTFGKGTIRKEILPRYFIKQYIASPDTVFSDCYKLKNGHIIVLDLNKELSVQEREYWSVYQQFCKYRDNQIWDYSNAKYILRNALSESVKKRLHADVAVGAFLSGGIDSSLVAAIAQEQVVSPINTFCIGFKEDEYDESKYAKKIANYLGTNHTEICISDYDMRELMDSLPLYYDEPFADASQIPTMLVSKIARERVKVVLSGDGGDELFCGYDLYKKIRIAQYLDFLGEIINFFCSLHVVSKPLYRLLPLSIISIIENRDRNVKTQIVSKKYIEMAYGFLKGGNPGALFANGVERNTSLGSFDDFITCKYPYEKAYNVKSWIKRRMLLDMDTWLPDDILTKVDRASMKYSLETRCPILDSKVIDTSFQIPLKYKLYKNDGKHILKDIAYDFIPRSLLDRKKHGFAVPISSWLRGELKEELLDYSSLDFLRKQNIFNPDFVNTAVNEYVRKGDGGTGTGQNFMYIIWPYFVFQKWYNWYMIR